MDAVKVTRSFNILFLGWYLEKCLKHVVLYGAMDNATFFMLLSNNDIEAREVDCSNYSLGSDQWQH
jgi:hypothetical protein